jgi:BAR domain
MKKIGQGLVNFTNDITMAIGVDKPPEDGEFEEKRNAFKDYERRAIRLRQAAEKYVTASQACRNAQIDVAKEVHEIYAEVGPIESGRSLACDSVDASHDCCAQLDKIVGERYRTHVIEPLNALTKQLHALSVRIQARNTKGVEMQRAAKQLAGLDKTKVTPERYAQAEEKAANTEREFREENALLKHDLAFVVENRGDILDAVLAVMLGVEDRQLECQREHFAGPIGASKSLDQESVLTYDATKRAESSPSRQAALDAITESKKKSRRHHHHHHQGKSKKDDDSGNGDNDDDNEKPAADKKKRKHRKKSSE